MNRPLHPDADLEARVDRIVAYIRQELELKNGRDGAAADFWFIFTASRIDQQPLNVSNMHPDSMRDALIFLLRNMGGERAVATVVRYQ